MCAVRMSPGGNPLRRLLKLLHIAVLELPGVCELLCGPPVQRRCRTTVKALEQQRRISEPPPYRVEWGGSCSWGMPSCSLLPSLGPRLPAQVFPCPPPQHPMLHASGCEQWRATFFLQGVHRMVEWGLLWSKGCLPLPAPSACPTAALFPNQSPAPFSRPLSPIPWKCSVSWASPRRPCMALRGCGGIIPQKCR